MADIQYTEVQKKKSGGKWACGCSLGCLGLILLTVAISIGAYFYLSSKLKDMTNEFLKLGFAEKEMAQVIEERDVISKKTLYIGQVVKIFADSNTDIAIISQTAEIHGKIKGNVFFRGQVLMIFPSGQVSGDVDVWAQVVENKGRVDGQIKGTYQVSQ